MKKYVLILAAAVATALVAPAGVAAADESPLGLPLKLPKVSDGSFEGATHVFDYAPREVPGS
ncbi:hypothetical protein ACIQM4_33485 [Streptomyces sp. NPDC091272]|uniref:hypothetical protein n=1 Tax=Streptomyces sp. NPDC091272 TaxID=3365981 RepID=UPI0038081574